MKLVTAPQMVSLEQSAIKDYGIDGLLLMENAARSFCDTLEKETGSVSGKTVSVFCGKGNNGGDGFAIGRHLSNRGALVSIIIHFSPEELKPDAKKNFDIVKNMGLSIQFFSEYQDTSVDLTIDALFGTGFHGEVTGVEKEMVNAINHGKTVISVDIPSGTCASDGSVEGDCVRADLTVTFALPKPGHYLYPAKEFCGKVVVAEISIPRHLIEAFPAIFFTLDRDLRNVLPKRKENSHKGSFGKVLLFAGSPGMAGAGLMAATAVLKTGAGMATVATAETITNLYAEHLKEAMTLPLPTRDDHLTGESIHVLTEKLMTQDVLLAGCGLGTSDATREILLPLLFSCEKPMVIDADGLNLLSGHIHIIKNKTIPPVLTPHPLEFSRIIGRTTEDIRKNRIEIAREFAKEFGVILVLKGSDTLIAHPNGAIYICSQSNSGLAKAGSGDVLAGVIAALIAQGATPGDAANLGVYLHSMAGLIAREEQGAYSMLSSDVLAALPVAINRLSNSEEM